MEKYKKEIAKKNMQIHQQNVLMDQMHEGIKKYCNKEVRG